MLILLDKFARVSDYDCMDGTIKLDPIEYAEWKRLQNRASSAVRRAVKSGKLANLRTDSVKCVDCGRRATMYDHRDYNKPLEVAPVCATCNNIRGSNAPKGEIRSFQCPNCGSGNVSASKKGFFCRRCGHTWQRKERSE